MIPKGFLKTRISLILLGSLCLYSIQGCVPSASKPAKPLNSPIMETNSLQHGRFANLIQSDKQKRHARQVFRETSTAVFVMELNADGIASVSRGWQYQSSNKGPQVKSQEHLREQLGYKGTWEKSHNEILVNLSINDSTCERIGEYSRLIPNHAEDWQLRCIPLTPMEFPQLTAPVLACELVGATMAFGENQPHIVPNGIKEGNWIILGDTYGIVTKYNENRMLGENPPEITVSQAPEPIPPDAWMKPF